MAWKISFSAQELIFSCRKQINSWQFLDLNWSFLQCTKRQFYTSTARCAGHVLAIKKSDIEKNGCGFSSIFAFGVLAITSSF
jgi:hypothetical protein